MNDRAAAYINISFEMLRISMYTYDVRGTGCCAHCENRTGAQRVFRFGDARARARILFLANGAAPSLPMGD
jgi:hypothetical protein